MNQVQTPPRVSMEQAVTWLCTLDINALGLQADAQSRARWNGQAGYRRPHNITLTAQGAVDACTGRPVDTRRGDVRIVDADVTGSQALAAIESLAAQAEFVEGLITSDLERLGLTAEQVRDSGLKRLLGCHCEGFRHAKRSLRGTPQWEALQAAARAGLHVQVDLLYGEDETPEHLAERLFEVRALQEETGCVDALVPLPHNAKRTVETPTEITFGFDDMRLLATARLVLDNVPHIQVPWLAFGLKAAQMGLVFGADDLGPWCLDTGVTEEAHVATLLALREEEILMAIKDSNRHPVLWKGQQ